MEQRPQDRYLDMETTRPINANADSGGILVIAGYNLVKAVFFLVAAAGVFHLVDRDTHVELTRLLHVFRINGDHQLVENLLSKASVVTNSGKRVLTAVLLIYTVLYTVEGIGLLLQKRWAEYFAVVTTAIPLPFEAYTVFHRPGQAALDEQLPSLFHNRFLVLKLAVLVINAGIVWFLVHHLRRRWVKDTPLAHGTESA